ncbi:enoyl-(acyl-carrier protein) reductase II [Candidatus Xenohaliotis californiensis]|uniref:Enoyl-(Acyl-carrier protein) reductase II n=1 Tax=Candidatus Xenohaliotis californiensis TaxID=84677 RepID=A0ABP0ESF0_9RICK|nr:enoyl-(acyl-carrier protein) reductase II [Candidatus Xenohaliotis californiensis]
MQNSHRELKKLWAKGSQFLGCPLSIMCGAMSWVSEANLVSAMSNAGGFGVIACGAMNSEQLTSEIQKTKNLTTKPFGVNLIVMHPDLLNLINVCIAEKVSHVVLAGGLAAVEHIRNLKDVGIKTMCFAPNLAIAKRSIKSNIDALIIEGSEAGGHIGAVSTSVLAQEILPHIKEVPVFVAGGIGSGEMMLRYLQMGASGCQLGTKFVCATESIAHPKFKETFIKANSRNAIASVQLDKEFPVIPVRALENKATKNFLALQRTIIDQFNAGKINKKEAQLTIEKYWAGALRNAVINGDVENGSLMAGQCVGMVKKEQSVVEIINDLIVEAMSALNQHHSFSTY